jgi:hypothetical protein
MQTTEGRIDFQKNRIPSRLALAKRSRSFRCRRGKNPALPESDLCVGLPDLLFWNPWVGNENHFND